MVHAGITVITLLRNLYFTGSRIQWFLNKGHEGNKKKIPLQYVIDRMLLGTMQR